MHGIIPFMFDYQAAHLLLLKSSMTQHSGMGTKYSAMVSTPCAKSVDRV